MSVPSFPLVLVLLLPGFLSIYAGFLVSRFRKLSAFQGTAWSLVAGLLLVVTLYPAYAYLVEPLPGETWPGLPEILENPALVPGQVWALLYAAAPLLGALIGLADRTGVFENVLRAVGIDLTSHGDLWGRLFRESGYVRVYLDDGNLLFGWPQYYSSDRSQLGPESYLTQVRIWDSGQAAWIEMEDVAGVLLDASHISRIEFLELSTDNENAEVVQ